MRTRKRLSLIGAEHCNVSHLAGAASLCFAVKMKLHARHFEEFSPGRRRRLIVGIEPQVAENIEHDCRCNLRGVA